MDCFVRAFECGLRYAGMRGIELDVPKPTPDRVVWKLIENFSLIRLNVDEIAHNEGVLICYVENKNISPAMGHSVFCSDIQPFYELEITIAIVGWDKLKDIWIPNYETSYKKLYNKTIITKDGVVGNFDELIFMDYSISDMRYIKKCSNM